MRAVLQNLSPGPNAKFDHWVPTTVPLEQPQRGRHFVTDEGKKLPVVTGRKWGNVGYQLYTWVEMMTPFQEIRGEFQDLPHDRKRTDRPLSIVGEVPWIQIRFNGKRYPTSGDWVIAEHNDACTRATLTYRIPDSMLVVDIDLCRWAISNIWDFWVCVTNSDPRTPVMQQYISDLSLHFRYDALANIFGAAGRGARFVPQSAEERGYFQLMRNDYLGDKQMLVFSGKFGSVSDVRNAATLAAELQGPSYGILEDWNGKWGPWGVIPPLHPKLTNPRAQFYRRDWTDFIHWANREGSVFDRAAYGTNKRAADTGDQDDFGVSKGGPALSPLGKDTLPAWIYCLSIGTQATGMHCENTREVDGSWFRAEKHPDVKSWGFTLHYDTNQSPGRLGKPGPGAHYGWFAQDFAHASRLHQAAACALGGIDWMQRNLRGCIEWIKARRGDYFEEERAEGRVPLVGAYAHWVTGDDSIVEYFNTHWTEAYYKRLFDMEAAGQPVALFAGPSTFHDQRTHVKGPEWSPWHQGLHIAGADGMNQYAKNPFCMRALKLLTKTHVMYGWFWHKASKQWVVGSAIHYKPDHQPLTEDEYQDATLAAPHWGTDYPWWCAAAVIIAKRYHANDPSIVARCDAILAQLKRWRADSEPSFDRAAEWIAVK